MHHKLKTCGIYHWNNYLCYIHVLPVAENDDRYLCYYCDVASGIANHILEHEIRHHCAGENRFSLRKRTLDISSEKMTYVSQHYGVMLTDAAERMALRNDFIIDSESITIRFKRKNEDSNQHDKCCSGNSSSIYDRTNATLRNQTEHEGKMDLLLLEKLRGMLPEVLAALKSIGRRKDFIDVVESIVDGKLSIHNIALDLGHYLQLNYTSQMRYNEISLNLWTEVQKLFKGKAVRFF